MKVGTCRLCLRENRELQNGHFISAAIYQVCKDGNKQPILAGRGTSRHTGGQIAMQCPNKVCDGFTKNGAYFQFVAGAGERRNRRTAGQGLRRWLRPISMQFWMLPDGLCFQNETSIRDNRVLHVQPF